jgi:hypothetical protein
MNEQVNDSHAAFMEAALKKIETQDKKIADMAQQIGSIPDNNQDIQQLKTGINELKAEIKNARFPVREMQEFSKQLTISAKLLREPVTIKTQHHHDIPKLIWITAGLFLALCLTSAGWYMTGQKMEGYKANDIKYRYLKLQQDSNLLLLLYRTDSLQQARPGFLRDSVIQEENARHRDYALSRKAAGLEQKANTLRGKIRKQ